MRALLVKQATRRASTRPSIKPTPTQTPGTSSKRWNGSRRRRTWPAGCPTRTGSCAGNGSATSLRWRWSYATDERRSLKLHDVKAGGPTTGIAALVDAVDRNPKYFKHGTELIESKDGTVAQINIPTVGSGNDQASFDALNKLRDDIVPATVGKVEGASVNVTGEAASSEDFRTNLDSRLPLIFAFVFGLAFLLMLITFRSIVIPIKTILLNLLSVGAAYGVLVLVFQNGNGEGLLGFTSNGGVTNWLPLFLFVVLFGLSMDYHVFILSRVRELYDRAWAQTRPSSEASRRPREP
jgi:uncharacterized membrane protein YdfJ with MMPL/SSD domain